MKKRKPTVVGLFAGCGGLDLGFINSGFKIVWANDLLKDAESSIQKFTDQFTYFRMLFQVLYLF